MQKYSDDGALVSNIAAINFQSAQNPVKSESDFKCWQIGFSGAYQTMLVEPQFTTTVSIIKLDKIHQGLNMFAYHITLYILSSTLKPS